MKTGIFSKMMGNNTQREGNERLLHEFENELSTSAVLFYPSSGFDLNDMFYVNHSRLPEIGKYNPKIFIHSDYLQNVDLYPYVFDWQLSYPDFELLDSCKWITPQVDINKKKSINLYRLKKVNAKEKIWLIFFRGYFNEEVLEIMLQHQIRIPIVYTVCDGITHGMGGYENSIPTLLYPLLSEELGIRWIITEQSWKSRKGRFEEQGYSNGKDECRKWMESVYRIYNKNQIKEALNLSDLELRRFLIEELGRIEEFEITPENRLKNPFRLNGLTLKMIK
jgi:hypothetical protein